MLAGFNFQETRCKATYRYAARKRATVNWWRSLARTAWVMPSSSYRLSRQVPIDQQTIALRTRRIDREIAVIELDEVGGVLDPHAIQCAAKAHASPRCPVTTSLINYKASSL